MKRRYQAYLFDLYGTLVDIHTDEEKDELWEKLSLLAAMRGADYRPAELREQYVSCVRRLEHDARAALQAAGAPPGSEPEIDVGEVFRAIFARKGVSVSGGELAGFARVFRVLSLEKLRLFDGAEDLLRRLRAAGKGVYLLSNAQALFTRPELAALGLEKYFDGVLLSSEAGRKKPDPAFYGALLDKYGLRGTECVMVGNDDMADCRGAAAAGLDSLYIRTEQSPPLSGPLPPSCRELNCIGEAFPK